MDLVPVRVRDCECPGTPHSDGDVVYLRPNLGLEGTLAAEADLALINSTLPQPRRAAAIMARWSITFITYGADGWNLVGVDKKPLPFDPEAVIADVAMGRLVAEQANALYQEAILAPLVAAQPRPKPSRNGQKAGTTSPPPTPIRGRSGSSSPSASAASPQSTA